LAASICYLSEREVSRLTNYGIEPNHKEHRHISIREAAELIALSDVRVVCEDEANKRVRAVAMAFSNEYVWKSRPSSGYNVRQMVPTGS
jgi:hypothetical protein